MTTTAHEDQFTDTPEPIREPLSRESILRRNIADLELALRTQTERAESYAETLRSLASYVGAGGYNADAVDAGVFEEKIRWGIGEIMTRAEAAEAELAKAAQQEPVGWRHENGNLFLSWQKDMITTGVVFSPLYAAPVPAPAVSAANPVQWLEDEGDMILVPRGLLGAACSSIDKQRPAPKVLEAMRHYTTNAPQAPAVPYGIDEEAANRIALAVYDCKNGIKSEPLLHAINHILMKEIHPLSQEGLAQMQPTHQPVGNPDTLTPHEGTTNCDGCGLTWLDDGLNPLGCPYCKDTVPAPAVPATCNDGLQVELRKMLQWMIGQRGKAGHNHKHPGIWDDDNGVLAGKHCEVCAMYDKARALLQSAPQSGSEPVAHHPV